MTTTTTITVAIRTKPLPRDPFPSARPPREDQRPGERTSTGPLKNGGTSQSDDTDDSNQWNYIFIAIVSAMFLIIVIMFVFLYKRKRPKEKEQEKGKASTPNMKESGLNEDASSRGEESERGRPATPAIPMTGDISLHERQPSPSRSSEAEQRNTANIQADMLSQLSTLIQTLVMEGRNHRPGDAQDRTYPDPTAPLPSNQVFPGPHHNAHGTYPNGHPPQQYHYPLQSPSHHVPNHLLAYGAHPNSDPGHPHPDPRHPHPHPQTRHDQQPAPRRHPAPPNQLPSGEQSNRSSLYETPYSPKDKKGTRSDPS